MKMKGADEKTKLRDSGGGGSTCVPGEGVADEVEDLDSALEEGYVVVLDAAVRDRLGLEVVPRPYICHIYCIYI